MTVANPT